MAIPRTKKELLSKKLGRPSLDPDKAIVWRSIGLQPHDWERLKRLVKTIGEDEFGRRMTDSSLCRKILQQGMERYERAFELPPLSSGQKEEQAEPSVGASEIQEVYDITDL